MMVRDIILDHKQGYYKPGKPPEGNIHFIRISDINDDFYLDKDSTPMISVESKDLENFDVKKGDFLFARTGGAGRFCLVTEDIHGIFASYLIRFRFNEEYDSSFLRYFFISTDFQNELKSKIHGGVNQNVHAENIKDCAVPTIPLQEQKQIVKILDEAFAAIEQAKANLEQNIANAQELFQSKLNEIFSQKGDGWEEEQLGDVFTFRQGIQRGVKLQSETQDIGQVRFLRIVDYTQGNELPRYIDHPGEQYIINEEDISLVRYGASTGFVCKGFSGALANNLFRVIPKENFDIVSDYLYYFLSSPVFQGYIKSKMNGAAMPAISFGMISKIPFPLTSENNQFKIAIAISKIESKTTSVVKGYEQKIKSLEELKKSILQKAFAGELTKQLIMEN